MKSTILIAVTCLGFSSFAQHNNELYINGAVLKVEAGAEVHVNGDIHFQGSSTITNNGLIRTQGNTFGNNAFQQRGTGTYRVENNTVNTGEWQYFAGNIAVRGGQAQIGVNDGSFYDLELANDMGVVAIIGISMVDVRNTVDFFSGATHNRIVTHNVPGAPLSPVYPTNGQHYDGVFGVMNPTSGDAALINSTVDLFGNMSGTDAGYIQGKFRRAVAPAGGSYGMFVGLHPGGAGDQIGFQYMRMDFQANDYDVVTTYFETASDNTNAATLECTSYIMDYWGGWDSGEWVVQDITGTGAGTYEVRVWPQDENLPPATVWAITRNDALEGTANECGPSFVGLTRGGYTGLAYEEFGVAASSTSILPIELVDINAQGMDDHIQVTWNVASEIDLDYYELQRSEDGTNFEVVGYETPVGGVNNPQTYTYDDHGVRYFQTYYYRVRSVDVNGDYDYTPVVSARIGDENMVFDDGAVNVYPNPSTADFSVSIATPEALSLELRVYNALGELLELRDVTIQEGNTVLELGANDWPPGMYHLNLRDKQSETTIHKKLLKK